MYTNGILLFMIGICFLMMVRLVFSRTFTFALKFVLRAVTGLAAVFAVDFLLSPWNIAVGINCFTAAVSALFGLPGVAMLFGWIYIFEKFF